MSWNFNPMAGPWLTTHIWEYYDYTRDLNFLKETGYELIKSSADFEVDMIWENNQLKEPRYVPDNIEAWQFGPVVPNVYDHYCGYGAMPISFSSIKYDVAKGLMKEK